MIKVLRNFEIQKTDFLIAFGAPWKLKRVLNWILDGGKIMLSHTKDRVDEKMEKKQIQCSPSSLNIKWRIMVIQCQTPSIIIALVTFIVLLNLSIHMMSILSSNSCPEAKLMVHFFFNDWYSTQVIANHSQTHYTVHSMEVYIDIKE